MDNLLVFPVIISFIPLNDCSITGQVNIDNAALIRRAKVGKRSLAKTLAHQSSSLI